MLPVCFPYFHTLPLAIITSYVKVSSKTTFNICGYSFPLSQISRIYTMVAVIGNISLVPNIY